MDGSGSSPCWGSAHGRGDAPERDTRQPRRRVAPRVPARVWTANVGTVAELEQWFALAALEPDGLAPAP
jgi:hypothetical protein